MLPDDEINRLTQFRKSMRRSDAMGYLIACGPPLLIGIGIFVLALVR